MSSEEEESACGIPSSSTTTTSMSNNSQPNTTAPLQEAESGALNDSAANNNEPVASSAKEENTAQQEQTTSTHNKSRMKNCSTKWTATVNTIHRPIVWFLQHLTGSAARHPKRTVALVPLISIAMIVIGYLTNFVLIVDEATLWTPTGSLPKQHYAWIQKAGFGFPDNRASGRRLVTESMQRDAEQWEHNEDAQEKPAWASVHDWEDPTISVQHHERGLQELAGDGGRPVVLFFHAEGDNVLTQKQVERVFEALDAVRNLDGYYELCSRNSYVDANGEHACEIHGVPRFWNTSVEIFEQQVNSEAEMLEQMSGNVYPDGYPFPEDRVFGFAKRNAQGILESAQSCYLYFFIPWHADELELDIISRVLELDNEWQANPDVNLRAEIFTIRSFADEFTRAIVKDIPLVAVVFFMMGSFTVLVFFKRDRVYSRSLLGFMAVVAVLFSVMSSYGLLFMIGVPFTSMTQLLPFIMFGIGLDDAFIIMGEYARTDYRKDPVLRIRETIDDVGVSITLTTITSSVAFALGCISDLPAVYWLCLYASPSVFMVYLYQLTFFVACIVLDERRIKARRLDICFCVQLPPSNNAAQVDEDLQDLEVQIPPETNPKEHPFSDKIDRPMTEAEDHMQHEDAPPVSNVDRFMAGYGHFLLRPWVRVLVVTGFVTLLVFCALSATQLRQEFSFTDVLPQDSYLADFIDRRAEYSVTNQMQAEVYFRNEDQSNETIRQGMHDYINELAAMDGVTGEPDFFWLRDFEWFVANVGFVRDLDFETQLGFFLGHPIAFNVYGDDIVLDANGRVISSRTRINMYNVDLDDVLQQVNTLKEQRRITASHPVNQGKTEFSFFTYAFEYNMWEFYSASVEELFSTAIIGVVSVTAVALILVPHWTAAPIVLPMMCILYVDLLGVMQWGGVTINAVSYVTLAMSIGLMVDFIMHVLLRYYECPGNRKEKTVEMLRTMGSSILVGGISTFLGVVPLVFSTSNIMKTVFVAFMGLVTLGVSHGLILLPVLLATFGTEDQVTTQMHREESRQLTVASTHEEGESSDDQSSRGQREDTGEAEMAQMANDDVDLLGLQSATPLEETGENTDTGAVQPDVQPAPTLEETGEVTNTGGVQPEIPPAPTPDGVAAPAAVCGGLAVAAAGAALLASTERDEKEQIDSVVEGKEELKDGQPLETAAEEEAVGCGVAGATAGTALLASPESDEKEKIDSENEGKEEPEEDQAPQTDEEAPVVAEKSDEQKEEQAHQTNEEAPVVAEKSNDGDGEQGDSQEDETGAQEEASKDDGAEAQVDPEDAPEESNSRDTTEVDDSQPVVTARSLGTGEDDGAEAQVDPEDAPEESNSGDTTEVDVAQPVVTARSLGTGELVAPSDDVVSEDDASEQADSDDDTCEPIHVDLGEESRPKESADQTCEEGSEEKGSTKDNSEKSGDSEEVIIFDESPLTLRTIGTDEDNPSASLTCNPLPAGSDNVDFRFV